MRGADLRRPDDADLGAGGGELLVERVRRALGVGALPVDHDPDWDTGARLVDQRRREDVADGARPEAELVDVDGGPRRGDVLEDPWVEGVSADEHLRGRGAALLECERQVGAFHGPGEQALRVVADVRDRDPTLHAPAPVVSAVTPVIRDSLRRPLTTDVRPGPSGRGFILVRDRRSGALSTRKGHPWNDEIPGSATRP